MSKQVGDSNIGTYKLLMFALLCLLVVTGVWYWLVFDQEATEDVFDEEPVITAEEDKFLYISGRSVEDMDDAHIYAYNLEKEELHKFTSGDFRYDFNTPDPGYVVMFGQYFGEVDNTVAGPEVPMWLNLETGRGYIFEVPNGFSKRNLSIAGDYIAYQQKSTTTVSDQADEGYGWETIIYETSTNRYVDLSNFFSPAFLGSDMHLALLGGEGIYLYNTATTEMDLLHSLEEKLSGDAHMVSDVAGEKLLVSTKEGHGLYEVVSKSPFTLKEVYFVRGNYQSGLLSENNNTYYIVNKDKSNSAGVWIENRKIKTGAIVDSFRISGFVLDQFSLDDLRIELLVAEFLNQHKQN